jgi:copper transport protein
LACAAILACALAPATALAHAALLSTTPGADELLQKAPRHVELTFDENIAVKFGGVKVYGPDGKRASIGNPDVDRRTVRLKVRDTGKGTYIVAWRVISADGHPIHGAFAYHAGARTGNVKDFKQEEHPNLDTAFRAARGFVIAGILIALGGMFFSTALAPSWRPRWVGRSLALVLVSIVAAFVLNAAVSGGFDLSEALSSDVLREVASTVYGRSALLVFVLALVSLGSLKVLGLREGSPITRRFVVVLPFIALAAVHSTGGHAIAAHPVWLRFPLDVAHTLAAAVWFGGLVQLVAYTRSHAVSATEVERFSTAALVSVVTIVVTGLYASFVEISLSVEALTNTTYGRLVLVKVALVLMVMPLAYTNKRRHVPALRNRESGARLRLRTYALVEALTLVVVIAATAWLIQSVPAKQQLRPGLFEQTVDTREGSAQLVIDPAESGSNKLHAYVFGKQEGVPDTTVTEITVDAANPARHIQRLILPVQVAGPAHVTASGLTIPYPGKWTFTVHIRRGEFDSDVAAFIVKIAPPG